MCAKKYVFLPFLGSFLRLYSKHVFLKYASNIVCHEIRCLRKFSNVWYYVLNVRLQNLFIICNGVNVQKNGPQIFKKKLKKLLGPQNAKPLCVSHWSKNSIKWAEAFLFECASQKCLEIWQLDILPPSLVFHFYFFLKYFNCFL